MILAEFKPKIQKVHKRGFPAGNYLFFWFLRPQNRGGGPPTRIVSKNIKSPEIWPIWVFLPALGWSCRTVLHTSVPAYRGFSTESPIFFGFSGPKIGMGGFLPPELSPKPSKPLEFGLFWSIFVCSGVVQQNSAAHQCTCIV